MSTFKLDIITPKGVMISEKVSKVTVPGIDGSVGILPGHATYTGLLGTGVLSFTSEVLGNDHGTQIVLSGGSMQVLKDGDVVILADEVEIPAGDIGFVRSRLAELRRKTEEDTTLTSDQKVFQLVEAYVEIEERYAVR